ncbi:MAG: hydrogenase maturation factor HoxX [Betaproteobacteria bacterium]|nr:MAG: hydrogenase maturation factor HoxX [Betaproteobacteria bacterium]
MRILFLAHAFNSLTQRLWAELEGDGHEVTLELDVNDAVTGEAVALAQPDLVIAPFLKRRIPDAVWRAVPCLVVHPGIEGDRGPSALDWAVQEGERDWGVTVLEANGEMDAGDIRASATFAMRDASKGSLYRNEVTESAVACLREAIDGVRRGVRPRPLDPARAGVRGRWRPAMKQADRAIDWTRDDTATVLRKVRAADGVPGVRDAILGLACHLFDAHAEPAGAGGAPAGAVVAQGEGAVLRATRDGAVWLTHLRALPGDGAPPLKLPAVRVLGERAAALPPCRPSAAGATWPAIRYEEDDAVGVLHFAFYNGAMSTDACRALRDAVLAARARPIRVLLLAGGPDFWSNGLDLAAIEAADQPADASWRNIEAMNDLVLAILSAERQVTIAALQGNAGAGGCFLALAADRVLARRGIVLNPHYKAMGNLYGSEYWTYLLPRRVGPARAAAIVANRLPLTGAQAAALGLVDEAFGDAAPAFLAQARLRAHAVAADPRFGQLLTGKAARRAADEAEKPLARYRDEELARMKLNFFGFDPSYHVARHHFIHKLPKARTPSFLARHRALRAR